MIVFKVEYSVENSDENWKTYILADNERDSIEFLRRYIGRPINVRFIDQYQEVHGISDSIIHRILDKYKVINKKCSCSDNPQPSEVKEGLPTKVFDDLTEDEIQNKADEELIENEKKDKKKNKKNLETLTER